MSDINFQVFNPMYWMAEGVEVFTKTLLAMSEVSKPSFKCPAGMEPIPGGKFQMGSTEGQRDEAPVHEVEISSFCMDKSEVTVEKFDAKGLGYRYKDEDFSRSNQPAVGVNWYGAKAYCEAMGKRLPTEAEWEYAARGPFGTAYMDSDSIDTDNAHYRANSTADVCTHETNGYGLCDMAGNAWEWSSDWYGVYSKESVKDPTGPGEGTYRVLRGGSWFNLDASGLRASSRFSDLSGFGSYSLGFRCVASPEDSSK